MDTPSAFAMWQRGASKGDPLKVFDWDKAARLIKERKPSVASAGLGLDWEWTGGDIFREGSPAPTATGFTFLESNWATPEIDLDGEVIDCWVLSSETEGWNAHTFWPASALAILYDKAEGKC